jgi:hypothetical protein
LAKNSRHTSIGITHRWAYTLTIRDRPGRHRPAGAGNASAAHGNRGHPAHPDIQCPHGGLRFLRCPSDDGAELMSWPPERLEDQTPFSIKIGITAQTLPTSDEVLVYLSFRVRR